MRWRWQLRVLTWPEPLDAVNRSRRCLSVWQKPRTELPSKSATVSRVKRRYADMWTLMTSRRLCGSAPQFPVAQRRVEGLNRPDVYAVLGAEGSKSSIDHDASGQARQINYGSQPLDE